MRGANAGSFHPVRPLRLVSFGRQTQSAGFVHVKLRKRITFDLLQPNFSQPPQHVSPSSAPPSPFHLDPPRHLHRTRPNPSYTHVCLSVSFQSLPTVAKALSATPHSLTYLPLYRHFLAPNSVYVKLRLNQHSSRLPSAYHNKSTIAEQNLSNSPTTPRFLSRSRD